MARRDFPVDDGAELRRYLLADAEDFRELCGHTPTMFAELSKPVDQLVGGERYRFPRYELPDDHPLRHIGGMGDMMTLTADDVIHARI